MKNIFWKNKRVLVDGGCGFIGSHVVEKLVEKKAKVTVFDNLQNGALRNIDHIRDSINFIKGDCTDLQVAERACDNQEVVMNLAARVGGIEYNRTHQGTMLRDNILFVTLMLDAGRLGEL
jgi:nucleoside-diphosphate-sugar epimerase